MNQKWFALVLGLSAVACSTDALVTAQQTIFDTEEEIRSLSIRADFEFDVVCADGVTERHGTETILDDEVCTVAGGDGFICTYADGKGREPWAAARVDNGRVTLFTRIIFPTVATCQRGLAERIERATDTYLCGSRDRDGEAPWTHHFVDHESQGASSTLEFVYDDFETCMTASRAAFVTAERTFLCAPPEDDTVWQMHELSGEDVDSAPELYASRLACFDAVRELMDTGLLCVSRDNDGVAPFVPAQRVGADLTRYDHVVYDSQQECQGALDTEVELGVGAPWVCASRDRDGGAPYALVERALNSSPPRLVYRSLEQCARFAERALVDTDVSLVCASRDKDGVAPWSIFEVGAQGPLMTDWVFDSIEECLNQL